MPAPVPVEILSATVTDVRPLASMLRALNFRPKAVMEIRDHGIKITVEEGRSIQAAAYLTSNSFASYSFTLEAPARASPTPSTDSQDMEDDAPHCIFGISLSTVLECLNIFGNATASGGGGGKEWPRRMSDQAELEKKDDGKVTSMRMSYSGEGEPLVLLLEESGIVTRCEITTYEPDTLMDLAFDDDTRVQKLIMKSEWLRDAFLELDPSSEKVAFMFSPAGNAPMPYNRYASSHRRRGGHGGDMDDDEDVEVPSIFRLEAIGTLGSTEMDYPNDKDVLETFECFQPTSNSYKFGHMQLTTKALVASTKVSIRTAEDGLLSFQFMIPVSGRVSKGAEAKVCFVEFLVSPLRASSRRVLQEAEQR
ncbi:Rad1/Rec1/Rad17 [Leucosporidium creatinivorum]|uniref:Rad1/Rec1/Rad17 n=1 Tax=Leucosporidium creatinivorum TaxID=106004 RepID=A0A1Y2BT53_9BASI|nr:Rad1/Rec1/Rad17 [Leucosporidium creatinivorum]